jgi:hypothetical protein
MTQTGLKLEIFLPQPPKCWHYRHAPPHPTGCDFLMSPYFPDTKAEILMDEVV